MDEKRLPNLQILLSVLFSVSALFAPLLMTRGSLVIGVLVALGMLLSGVTLAIGWRAYVQRRPVQYPFYAWSLRLLRIFAGEAQLREIDRAPRQGKSAAAAAQGNLRLLGMVNLALGGLLLVGMLYAALILFY